MNNCIKKHLLKVVWGTIKTILLSFGIYIASSTLLQLMFYQDTPPGQRDFTPVHCSMLVIFGISFYFAYLGKYSEKRTIKQKDKFSWKDELIEFVQLDGKYLFILYIFLAVVNEVGYLLHITPLTTFLYPCFAMSPVISIPIIRTGIAYIISMLVIIATALLRHYKDYRYWSKRNNMEGNCGK